MTPVTNDEQTLSNHPFTAPLQMPSEAIHKSRGASRPPHTPVCAAICKQARVCVLLTWAVLLATVTSCGTGFTGGSIPEGKSVVRGRVIAADNTQLPLAGVAVTLLSTPTGEPTQSFRVATDAQGQFSVTGIYTGKRPVGAPPTVSNVVVSVDTGKTPYVPQKLAFLLTSDRGASVILAVPPTSVDLNQVGSVSVKAIAAPSADPAGTVGATGLVPTGQLAFRALLLDRSGNALVSAATGQPLVPSLTLDGLVVDAITPDGVFSASVFPAVADTGGANANSLTTAVSVGDTVSITGSVSLPGAAPSVGTPLSVPIIAVPTSASATGGKAGPGTSPTAH